MRGSAIALGCVVFLAAKGGHTSGRRDVMTLEQLVSRSSLIVLAEPATPPTRTVPATLKPPAGGPPWKGPLKEIQRHFSRWQVRELLKGSGAKVGEVLEVRRAQESMWLHVQAKAEYEGVNKIVLIDAYESPRLAAPGPGDAGTPARILFLSPGEGGFELSAEGGVEAPAAAAEVRALVGPQHPEDDVPPPPSPPRRAK